MLDLPPPWLLIGVLTNLSDKVHLNEARFYYFPVIWTKYIRGFFLCKIWFLLFSSVDIFGLFFLYINSILNLVEINLWYRNVGMSCWASPIVFLKRNFRVPLLKRVVTSNGAQRRCFLFIKTLRNLLMALRQTLPFTFVYCDW